MRKLLLIVLLLQGCSSVQSSASFREQQIVVGQSSDSVEKLLGQPDEARSQRFFPGVKMVRLDWFVLPGQFTIEWIYWDSPKSLVLWLEGNAVQAIWLVETSRLKR